MQKGFAVGYVLAGILVLFAVVGGVYYLGATKSAVPKVQEQAVSQTLKPTATDETANWKTFSNSRYNFSFNYPANWTVTTEEQQQELLKVLVKGPNQITLSFMSGPPGVGGMCVDDPNINLGYESINIFNKPLNLFYNGDRSKNIITFAYVIEGNTTCPNIAFFDIPALKGVDASWVKTRLGSVHIYYGEEKNNIEKKESDFKSAELETVKKILSTFKFLDENLNSDITVWNTYTNTQLKISFKYPETGDILDVGNSGNVLYFTNDKNPPYYIFSLKIIDNQQELAIRQFIDNDLTVLRNSKSPGSDTLADKRQASIKDYQNGEIKGLYMRGGADGDSVTDFIRIVTENKGKIYQFEIHDGDGAVVESQKKLIDQILSTFKFLNQDQITNNSKSCQQNSDCALLQCSGCFNKDWVKTVPPDLACLQYSGYQCECMNNKCTEIQ